MYEGHRGILFVVTKMCIVVFAKLHKSLQQSLKTSEEFLPDI